MYGQQVQCGKGEYNNQITIIKEKVMSHDLPRQIRHQRYREEMEHLEETITEMYVE